MQTRQTTMQAPLINSIICGDCQYKMQQHIPSDYVDLIYLDPPFFSGKNYEVIWKDGAEIRSFEDTEFYTLECECGRLFPENHMFCAFCGAGKDVATERRSSDIEAYLQWLRPKLVECKRVLNNSGSIYCHLDWHAVHYVKVMMDDIFGRGNFRNEIVWHYNRWTAASTNFQRMHDNILFYTKNSKEWVFNKQYKDYSEASKKAHSERGYIQRGSYKSVPNPKGVSEDDVWNIQHLAGRSKERLGYPTQKPEALLERIILTSSNIGDIILDPFCGCGTAVAVAEKLGRRWIGIDISPTSCKLMTDRLRSLKSEKGENIGYSIGYSDIIDMPMTVDELRAMPPFEFQNWAVQQLGGKQEVRKSGDGGIDGWTFVGDPIQVKQVDKVGRDVVKLLVYNVQRIGKTHGIIVAFSFGKGAYKEAIEAKAQFGIDIEFITVEEMIQ